MLLLICIIIFLAVLGPRLRRLFSDRYDHNPYRYGCRRHHGLLGSILPIVALVALDRLLDLRH